MSMNDSTKLVNFVLRCSCRLTNCHSRK